jgi:hypothetical protein
VSLHSLSRICSLSSVPSNSGLHILESVNNLFASPPRLCQFAQCVFVVPFML